MLSLTAIILLSQLILSVGTYFIWFSRWNLLAHIQLGFAITSYLIPIAGAGVLEDFKLNLVYFYAMIIAIGAFFYIIGLYIGFKSRPVMFYYSNYSFIKLTYYQFFQFISQRTIFLLWISIIGIIISFIGMGFIPILAEDPLMAKFFRGVYHERYILYAPLFRSSMFVVQALIPVTLVLGYITKKFHFILLALLSITINIVALTRGTMASGLLLFLGIIVAYRNKWLKSYLFLLIIIFPLGSVSYYLMFYMFGFGGVEGIYDTNSIASMIASGAPDVVDQLNFLDSFLNSGSLTYGLTFIGGLIPYNFPWNPSVWTLNILNPNDDINTVGSGGLRLLMPMYGYTAFGWIGVVLISFSSGFLHGKITRWVKSYISTGSILQSMVVFMVYSTLGMQIANFYLLSIYNVPSIIISLCLLFPVKFVNVQYFKYAK
jgi:hypothetical protein